MSKLYIPENVWLVCSEGTSTQQMLVTSQSKVKIDGGYLMATTADRVKTDFGCKKEALADAIGVAICAMVIAACVVGTGGLGACAIIGLAGAAGAVGGGILGRVMPCGCARCMGPWQNFSPSVIVSGYNALLDDSFSICSKGGTIKIMFSKEAAEAYAALVAMKSNTEIANVAAIAFALPFVLKGAGTAIIGFKGGFTAALAVSSKAAFLYTLEASMIGGASYGIGILAKEGKESIYKKAGVYNYTKGKEEEEVTSILGNDDGQKDLFDAKSNIGKVGKIGKRKSYSITSYEKMSYEREGYLSTTKGYIEEKSWETVEEKANWKYKATSTKSIEKISSTDKLTQSTGAYYMKEEYTLKTGKDYNIGKGLGSDFKKGINPFGHMFAIDLLIDLSRGICNKLLENKKKNYEKILTTEQKARNAKNVKTK